MNHFEEFCKQFKPLLCVNEYKKNQYNRWPAFEFIAKELLEKNRPINIIETGTLRAENDWLGYGHSALLWDWIISKTGGNFYSVDIDHEAIRFARARCKNINLIHCDSVGYLRTVDAEKVDILYLDSYNWSKEDHISSCLHHMTELGAIWDRLPSGCLIAIDDRHTDHLGKHVLVELFFVEIIRIQPLIKCHVIVWRKP